MAIEQTLSILKPDTVGKNNIGAVIDRFEKKGLRVIGAKMHHLAQEEAESFYAIHKERPFFRELVDFMISGPVVMMVLEGENAIEANREIMGATNPKEAVAGTIRADFADSIDENAVHGSDGKDTAALEIKFFFNEEGVCKRTR